MRGFPKQRALVVFADIHLCREGEGLRYFCPIRELFCSASPLLTSQFGDDFVAAPAVLCFCSIKRWKKSCCCCVIAHI